MVLARLTAVALATGLLVAADEDERPGVELITAQISALESPPLSPKARGELSLILLEAPDRDMPLLVRIEASGLELVDDRLGWSQVVDPLAVQPRVRAPFHAPERPGTYEVHASVDYWVCGQRACRRKHGEVSWSIIVEGAE